MENIRVIHFTDGEVLKAEALLQLQYHFLDAVRATLSVRGEWGLVAGPPSSDGIELNKIAMEDDRPVVKRLRYLSRGGLLVDANSLVGSHGPASSEEWFVHIGQNLNDGSPVVRLTASDTPPNGQAAVRWLTQRGEKLLVRKKNNSDQYQFATPVLQIEAVETLAQELKGFHESLCRLRDALYDRLENHGATPSPELLAETIDACLAVNPRVCSSMELACALLRFVDRLASFWRAFKNPRAPSTRVEMLLQDSPQWPQLQDDFLREALRRASECLEDAPSVAELENALGVLQRVVDREVRPRLCDQIELQLTREAKENTWEELFVSERQDWNSVKSIKVIYPIGRMHMVKYRWSGENAWKTVPQTGIIDIPKDPPANFEIKATKATDDRQHNSRIHIKCYAILNPQQRHPEYDPHLDFQLENQSSAEAPDSGGGRRRCGDPIVATQAAPSQLSPEQASESRSAGSANQQPPRQRKRKKAAKGQLSQRSRANPRTSNRKKTTKKKATKENTRNRTRRKAVTKTSPRKKTKQRGTS